MNPRVVTVGAAVQDVFLQGKIFTPKQEDGQNVEEFLLGSKNEIEGVVYSTGGGATNAAVTFARQGIEVAYLGKTGNDVAGQNVRHDLSEEGVDTTLMSYSDKGTGFSALLLAPNGERTILTYRGASTHYDLTDEEAQSIKADWLYVSSLEGNFAVIEKLLLAAQENSTKVIWNPGKKELAEPEQVKALLHGVTVLSLNKEEMLTLFAGDTLADLVRAACQQVQYAVATDGPNGLAACDGREILTAGLYQDVPVIDRTGAGDAFCSGLAACLVAGGSLREAVVLGSANSTSVVGQIGAKAGILKKGVELLNMPITSQKIK